MIWHVESHILVYSDQSQISFDGRKQTNRKKPLPIKRISFQAYSLENLLLHVANIYIIFLANIIHSTTEGMRICAIRLPHANTSIFHTILSIYYHVTKYNNHYFIVVVIRVNEKKLSFFVMILTQHNLHGSKGQPICEGNLIAHIVVHQHKIYVEFETGIM